MKNNEPKDQKKKFINLFRWRKCYQKSSVRGSKQNIYGERTIPCIIFFRWKKNCIFEKRQPKNTYTVVSDCINTMKTILPIWILVYIKLLNLKSFSFITCKLLIRKKLVNNQNLNRKFVFIVLVNRLPMWKSKKEVRIIWQIKEKCRTSYFSLWKIQKLESITELKEKVLKFRNRSKIRRIRINLRKIQNQRKYQD